MTQHNLTIIELDSKSEMNERLRLTGSTLVVGATVEGPNHFFLISLDMHLPLTLGLMVSGFFAKPRLVFFEEFGRLLIGHDADLTWIDAISGQILKEHELNGAFFEFVQLTKSETIVVHELGVLKVSCEGAIRWDVSTPDIVEGFGLRDDEVLELQIWDSDQPLRVAIKSGELV